MSSASNFNSAAALGVVLLVVLGMFSGGYVWLTRTRDPLISSAQRVNRARGKIVYRIVLTVVIVIFTLVFIGPLYFLFTDGLKSTQEAIATGPPTLYPHALHASSYARAWGEVQAWGGCSSTPCTTRSARSPSRLVFRAWRRPTFAVQAPSSARQRHPRDDGHATLMIPAMVLIVPLYITVAHLPIVNISLIGLVEPRSGCRAWPTGSTSSCSSGSSTLIPAELTQAAAIDGASPLRILQVDHHPDLEADSRRRVDLLAGRGMEEDFLLAAAGRGRV